MQQAISIDEQKSSAITHADYSSRFNLYPSPFELNESWIRRSTPKSTRHEIRKILIIDRSGCNWSLIKDSLECESNTFPNGIEQFEILKATGHEAASDAILKFSPNLIIADWDTMITSAPYESGPSARVPYHLPILLVMEKNSEYPKVSWRNITSGIVDYIKKPIDTVDLRNRIQVLLSFTNKLKEMKEETSAIRDNLNIKHLELHLELLMHSGNVKDKFLEDIHQLSPFLSVEGRSKLKHLVKQFRWALNDENSTNFIRAFDKINEPLYKQLENICSRITKNEKRLCAFTVKDQTGSEIAKVMGKTQNCINVAFARLRSKLGLSNNKDLKSFLLDLTEQEN